MWKKIVETEDVISFEKSNKALKIRIEARMQNKQWKIFKKYMGKDVNYTEEIEAESRDDAKNRINRLMKKNLSIKDIKIIEVESKKSKKLAVQRVFRDYSVEKWQFKINGDDIINILYQHTDDSSDIDLILHSIYKPYEKQILDELNTTFGIDKEFGADVKIYYFDDMNHRTINSKKAASLIGKIEIGYDVKKEE